MRLILSIILCHYLFSCASGPSKKKPSKSYDDLSDIESFERKRGPSKKYNRASDLYSPRKGEKDALITESLARVPSKIARSVAGEDDPISQIIGHCYDKDFKSAFEVADNHYEGYKKNPAYWNQIGSCYLLKGEQKKASIFYNKARSFDSRYVPAINNLGVIYEQRGKDELALSQFKRARKLNYSAKTPRFNVANTYLQYGLHQKACPLFTALDKFTPGDPDVVNALSICHLLRGQYSLAVNKFKEMDRDFYERPYIGINYALALKLTGKTSDAQDILNDIDMGKIGPLKKYHRKVKNYISRGRR